MSRRVRFVIDCPDPGCNCNGKAISFTHATCGGNYRIYDDGYLECQECFAKDILINSHFKCGNSQYSPYRESTKRDIIYQLIRIYSTLYADDEFKKKLLESICKMIVEI